MKWYIWLIIFAAVIGITIVGVLIYNGFKAKNIEIDTANKKLVQVKKDHEQALYKQKFEIEKDIYATVDSLLLIESTLKNNKAYWYTQTITLQARIDTLINQGEAQGSIEEDENGKYYRVDFSDKIGIMKYSGFTKYYIDESLKKYHYLSADFDSIDVSSVLYEDSTGLWKIKSISKTPGVKIRSLYNIDDSFYDYLEGMSVNIKEEKVYLDYFPFGLRVKMNFALNENDYSKLQLTDIKGYFTAEIYYRYFNITYHAIENKISAGLMYDLNFEKTFNTLFRAL